MDDGLMGSHRSVLWRRRHRCCSHSALGSPSLSLHSLIIMAGIIGMAVCLLLPHVHVAADNDPDSPVPRTSCAIRNGRDDNLIFPACFSSGGITIGWAFRSSDSHLHGAVTAYNPFGYIAWGLSPARQAGKVMLNSSALVAFRGVDGAIEARMYKLDGRNSSAVRKDAGTLDIISLAATFDAETSTTLLHFEIRIDPVDLNDATMIWAKGDMLDRAQGVLLQHAVGAMGYRQGVNFAATSEGNQSFPSGSSRTKNSGGASRGVKNIHGAFGVLSYGIIIPLGVIVARHLRPGWEDWFDTHRGMQVVGFILGLIAFALGLMLGSESHGVTHKAHRNIGITIIVFSSLQVLALVFRPGKDHEWRKGWSLYHHIVGYLVVLLGIVQVFKGFAILHVAVAWKVVYILVLILILLLETGLESAKLYRWYLERQQQPKGPQHMPAGRMPSGLPMEDMTRPGPRQAYNTQNIAI